MPFMLSPGVAVVEKDFSAIVPAVSTSAGGFAGDFVWGPMGYPVTIPSENVLVETFGKPTDDNFESFFTAANFLSYTNNLKVVRIETESAKNAVAVATGSVIGVTMSVNGAGYTTVPTVTFGAPQVAGGTQATGTAVLSGGTVTNVAIATPGNGYTSATITFSAPQVAGGVTATGTVVLSGGGVDSITIVNAGSGYTSAPTATISGDGTNATVGTITISASSVTGVTITNPGTGYSAAPSVTFGAPGSGTTATGTSTVATGGVKILNAEDYITNFSAGEGVTGEFAAKYPGALGNSLSVSVADNSSFATWTYKSLFATAPGTSSYTIKENGQATNIKDEMHIVVIDTNGAFTGTRGEVLEKYAFVSKASDAKKSDGSNNYYKNVLNNSSKYIWWTDHPASSTGWGSVAKNAAFSDLGVNGSITRNLSGGVDDLLSTDGQKITAWNIFANSEQYDISLLPIGKASATVATAIIGNVAETRLDCVAFVSPQDVSSGEVIIGSGSAATDAINAYRNLLPSTSYAVLDSGYKYQYDRYNDVYRWVPLNGDVAGLCARTDYTTDPWFSPSGMSRGQVKNSIKLAINPNKTDRDELYKNGVNPVVAFPGEGTVLFGDKTLLAKPSAFDRINVRRLFIVLEKAIAIAAKFQLFEFNDSFTRAQFKNIVEPFLRDVQGRRGVTDFRVVCNETNNTSTVIDRNEFVADIYIKPNRSINYITLNFVAARSGVNFEEIGA